MRQQRLQDAVLAAELMQQSSLADAALARQGLERQFARTVTGKNGESRLNGGVARSFRAGGIVHELQQEE
jgi:hypothetical protein